MIHLDEDSLICDLAETYNIYDYRSMPASLISKLAVGLRANSRIKMKMAGMSVDTEVNLLASISDKLSLLLWMNSKDGAKGRNKPKLITEMINKDAKEDNDVMGYSSVEEFEKAYKEITGGI